MGLPHPGGTADAVHGPAVRWYLGVPTVLHVSLSPAVWSPDNMLIKSAAVGFGLESHLYRVICMCPSALSIVVFSCGLRLAFC